MDVMYLTVEPRGAGRLGVEHLEACLAACPFPVHAHWVCGDWVAERGGEVILQSGFSIRVADGPFPTFADATAAAAEFLERHAAELSAFSRHPAVAELWLRLPLGISSNEAKQLRIPQRLTDLGTRVGVHCEVVGVRNESTS